MTSKSDLSVDTCKCKDLEIPRSPINETLCMAFTCLLSHACKWLFNLFTNSKAIWPASSRNIIPSPSVDTLSLCKWHDYIKYYKIMGIPCTDHTYFILFVERALDLNCVCTNHPCGLSYALNQSQNSNLLSL